MCIVDFFQIFKSKIAPEIGPQNLNLVSENRIIFILETKWTVYSRYGTNGGRMIGNIFRIFVGHKGQNFFFKN